MGSSAANGCIVKCEIRDEEIAASPWFMPATLFVLSRLRESGFEFVDDALLSSAVNENPVAIGTLTRWYDARTCTTHFRQDKDAKNTNE